jgi:hypothetical protein
MLSTDETGPLTLVTWDDVCEGSLQKGRSPGGTSALIADRAQFSDREGLADSLAGLSRVESVSPKPSGTVFRCVDDLRKQQTYTELQLTVSAEQLAALTHLGDLVFKDPLLITREGVIIDGYARKEYAEKLGVSTLACVELDLGEEEALRMILVKHRRSPGWNDYNRIRMAARLKDVIRLRARSNQQAGGHFKGLSKLTEAKVRKEIAAAAGVSEGNVTKVEQVRDSDPEVLAH